MADSQAKGSVEDLKRLIPQSHRHFMQQFEYELHIPPMREDAPPPKSVYRNMELMSTHGWARPQLEVVWPHRPKLLVSVLGPAPADVVAKGHGFGIKIGGMTGSGRHSEKHIAAGAEFVIAAGNEGAGHNSDVSTMVLVPEVVDAPEPLGTPLQRMIIAPTFRRIAAARMTEHLEVPIGQIAGQIHHRRRVSDVMPDL